MEQPDHPFGAEIGRRRFLQVSAGGLAWWLAGAPVITAQANYRVGVGGSSGSSEADPYQATRRAVDACADWPASKIFGQTVIIKPNLVNGARADTGTTTDPQVVRALVDLALASGAARVLIVEYMGASDKFSACGYNLFRDYDPDGRVELLDLDTAPAELRAVPNGMAYLMITLPKVLFEPGVVYISAAKLKTHSEALATLSMKNSFGLPPIAPYQDSALKGRFAMHKRSVSQTTVDINLVRPIDFAVVDGVWGMEGNGPMSGAPVQMNMVLAGNNALAVDRVCQKAMGLPALGAQHLEYAARKGLGPASLGQIQVLGDALRQRTFVRPSSLPPVIEQPRPNLQTFAPRSGQSVSIRYGLTAPCFDRVEIVQTDELRPTVTLVRVLRAWTNRPAGVAKIAWDGRDDNRQYVPAGFYSVRVGARFGSRLTPAYATGGVWVADGTTPVPANLDAPDL